jgi:Domain of unknown function (DUF1929)
VFTPPYLFRKDGSGQLAPRPEISFAPGDVGYGARFVICPRGGASISKVALVRLGAVTHSVNMEQRYVPLSFATDGAGLVATGPANPNVAPPGVYMLFVIGADGVPSIARMVQVSNAATPAPPPTAQLCSTPGPVPSGQPSARGAAIDTESPRLTARIKRRQRVLRVGGVVARAGCDEPCAVSGWGRLRIGGRGYALARRQTAQSGRRVRLKVRLTGRAERALRRALRHRRRATARISLRARDGAGNRSSVVRADVLAVR